MDNFDTTASRILPGNLEYGGSKTATLPTSCSSLPRSEFKLRLSMLL